MIAPALRASVGSFLARECDEAQRGAFSGTEWSLQGLGMLRCSLASDSHRLHVWDSRYRTPDVSILHDHPWDFDSVVVAGIVANTRFEQLPHTMHFVHDGEVHESPAPHSFPMWKQPIICGPGGGECANAVPVYLRSTSVEYITEGVTYTQCADEIHRSEPEDGTVTIIDRTPTGDGESAHVYFDPAKGFVSAEPRPATADEVYDILRESLATWWL